MTRRDVTTPVTDRYPINPPIIGPPVVVEPPPSASCPASPPQDGQACAGSLECHYDSCGGPSAICNDGRWQVYYVSCNPPPQSYECPVEQPEYGSSCGEYAYDLSCAYEYCYEVVPLVRCNDLAVWEAIPVPTCNPPPPDVPGCPAIEPQAGVSCAYEGESCEYGDCGVDSPPRSLTCTNGSWQLTSGGCGEVDGGAP